MKLDKLIRAGLLSASVLTGVALIAAPALAAEADAGAADAADGANEILVTATRRSSALADVPINIAVVGADTLASQRINDIRSLGDLTPGVTINNTGPRASGTIVLRGLSADDVSDFGSNNDNAVAIYLGEVPLYADFKLLDLQRVEVLLGPQGTLYGAGTLAGAIRYLPNRPDTTKFSVDAHVRASAVDEGSQLGFQGDATVNIPIIKDHLALRSTVGYYYEPGFIDNPFLLKQPGVSLPQPGGAFDTSITQAQYDANFFRAKDVNFERTWTTRNTLLVEVNPDLKAYFTAAFQQTKTNGRQSNGAFQFNTGKYELPVRYLEPADRRTYLYSAEIQANLGEIAQLVSSTAYTLLRRNNRSENTDLLLDLSYSYEAFPAFSSYANGSNRNEQFTQELRLVSTHGGPISWTLGGFYNHQKNFGDRQEYTPGFAAFIDSPRIDDLEYISFFDNSNKEKAVFGEATVKFTDAFQVTGGLRYYKYDATARGGTDLPLFGGGLVRTPYPLIQFAPSRIGSGKASSDGFVYKANASYKFREGLLIYGTFSTGYRIGGPNTVAPCILPLGPGQNVCALPNELFYGPDKTYNKEIGIRGTFFDGRLTINADVYHIVWSGLQVGSQTVNGAVGITTNAGAAVSKGFEFNGSLRLTNNLTLSGSYAYVDAHLTQDAPGLIVRSGADGSSFDAFAGDRLPGSQKHSGSLIANWKKQIGDDTSLAINWGLIYHGNQFTKVGNRGFGEVIPSYWLNRASINLTKGRYEIGVYANNIFNVYAINSVGNDFAKIGVQNQDYGISRRYYSYSVLTPRTVGIEARVHF
ncbi:TonB-dependent receptor [Sandarakinorhabdus oryzae]|uniref:TonB-dependent receptor n=1 Tax=Sandarakinorhabdus oryzae TaxID=2675220 RepID=UPI0012E2018C|nr:TonB-dependent receptor [Sandarakinorhabdus oryzae]